MSEKQKKFVFFLPSASNFAIFNRKITLFLANNCQIVQPEHNSPYKMLLFCPSLLLKHHISNTSPIHLQYISNSSPIHLQFISNYRNWNYIGIKLEKNWRKTGIKYERNKNDICRDYLVLSRQMKSLIGAVLVEEVFYCFVELLKDLL